MFEQSEIDELIKLTPEQLMELRREGAKLLASSKEARDGIWWQDIRNHQLLDSRGVDTTDIEIALGFHQRYIKMVNNQYLKGMTELQFLLIYEGYRLALETRRWNHTDGARPSPIDENKPEIFINSIIIEVSSWDDFAKHLGHLIRYEDDAPKPVPYCGPSRGGIRLGTIKTIMGASPQMRVLALARALGYID